MKIDPFTRTPGVAGAAFIDMHYADEIIQNFQSDESSKYVYKIVGLRGSGKSVEYRKIVNALSGKKNWLVYTLSAAGDPITSLLAALNKEPFLRKPKTSSTTTTGVSEEANIAIVKGSADIAFSRTVEEDPNFFLAEVALTEMIQKANDNGYKVLVGVDDIAKTPEMVRFLSLWGSMLLDDRKKIYLVCTGLSKNIEEFASEANLTFFKRSDLIEIGALDKFEMADMYRQLLDVNETEAAEMSKFTCGYAYAYQVLGSLYFKHPKPVSLQELLPEFDKILFRDSYELIWASLTQAEQTLVRCIVSSKTGSVTDIRSMMQNNKGYSSLRSRLDNKHLINTSKRGYISIDLPRFKDYVLLWHDTD